MKALSPKKLREQIGFHPHSAQMEILRKMRRFTIICAGRKFGKTLLISFLALLHSLLNDKIIWIVSPTYELSQKSFNYIVKWAVRKFPQGAFKINKSDLSIYSYDTGSTIKCKSADSPDSLLGEDVHLLILDEASRIEKQIWESYLRANLSATKGKALFISTPVSKENWFYRLYLRGKDSASNKEWISFSYPSMENPYLSEEDIQEAKETLPSEVFNREYDAVFLDSSYQVFKNVRDCVSQNLPRSPQENRSHIIGLDLAKMRDFSVVVVVDKETREVVYLDRWSKLAYPIQKDRIVSIADQYRPARIIIDSLNVGGAIADDLRSAGLWVEDFKSTGTISKDWEKRGSKERLIEHLALFFQKKAIRIPSNEILIDELESYGMELSERGNVRYTAPSGLNDDCVDALALAMWGLRLPREPQTAMEKVLQEGFQEQKRKRIMRDQSFI